MQRTSPPFRADHVGSLLRSAALKDARAKRERGEITAEQLKAVEDREIDNNIKKQEAVGLKSITDGEYRRAFWNYDFLGKLPGVGPNSAQRIAFHLLSVEPPEIDRLKNAPLDEVVLTNTLPLPEAATELDNITVLSVAPIVAEALEAIFMESSVSEIFLGENL